MAVLEDKASMVDQEVVGYSIHAPIKSRSAKTDYIVVIEMTV